MTEQPCLARDRTIEDHARVEPVDRLRHPGRRARRGATRPLTASTPSRRRRAVRPRGTRRPCAGSAGSVDRARGRHRGRVPPAAPRAVSSSSASGPTARRGRRELDPRARRAGRDGRLRRARGRRAAARRAPTRAPTSAKARRVELRDIVVADGADTVVCDGELAPSQRRALEDDRQGQGHRPDRPDPRHLRPARQEPRGQGPGRARPAAVPAAAPAWLG